MVISQLSGFNTLMYYSSTLFALVGFSNPVAVGLVVAGGEFSPELPQEEIRLSVVWNWRFPGYERGDGFVGF